MSTPATSREVQALEASGFAYFVRGSLRTKKSRARSESSSEVSGFISAITFSFFIHTVEPAYYVRALFRRTRLLRARLLFRRTRLLRARHFSVVPAYFVRGSFSRSSVHFERGSLEYHAILSPCSSSVYRTLASTSCSRNKC